MKLCMCQGINIQNKINKEMKIKKTQFNVGLYLNREFSKEDMNITFKNVS